MQSQLNEEWGIWLTECIEKIFEESIHFEISFYGLNYIDVTHTSSMWLLSVVPYLKDDVLMRIRKMGLYIKEVIPGCTYIISYAS